MTRTMGLFLGAGASYEAGMPLASELTTEIKNWLTADRLRWFNAGWKTQGGGYADAAIEDLNSILARPEVHYEAALGHLEAQYRRHRPLAQQYHGLYSWLVELVYQLLYYRQVNNNAFLDKRLADYEGIRSLTEHSTPLWVFSLNHDVMIEALAARFRIPLYSGFSSETVTLPRRDSAGKKKGEIRAEVLTKDNIENGALHFPNPPRPGIYLFKIHGALDEFVFSDNQDLLKLLPDRPGQEGVFEILRAANEELFYLDERFLGGKVKTTNEISYADDSGELQFLRRSLLAGAFKFDTRRSQVLPQSLLKHFRANLNFVKDLVCIGYGFGDQHVNVVLREWLEFTPDRQMEIVDPVSPKVPSFLLHLIPQVKLTKSPATDYLDSRAGIVRSRRAQLERRVGLALRALGKEGANKALGSFFALTQQRLAQELGTKVQSLPLVDGNPSFEGTGEPKELVMQWAAELKLTKEDMLDGLLKHVETNG